MITLFIPNSDYMTWLSVIVAILSLLVMILIGWQIFNYVYFEKKLKKQIKVGLKKQKKKLREENTEQMATSNYFLYLTFAKSHSESFGWELDVVLDNLSLAIDFLLEIKSEDDRLIQPFISFVDEKLIKNKCFEINSIRYAKGVDRFIPQIKKLLKKDISIYKLLKEIEKQIENRQELTDENDYLQDFNEI